MRRLIFALYISLPAILNAQGAFTALTYNIRYDSPDDGDDAWSKRRDFLAGQLRFHAPDVFGIQEGLLHQLQYLDGQLPEFARVGVGRDDGDQAGEFSALYYRKSRFGLMASGTFWLSDTPDTVSKGWDAALPRICTFARLYDSVARKKLWVFNTHFDHVGKTARRESAALILNKIAEMNIAHEAVILMGDLNAEPEETPVVLISKEMQDARQTSEALPFGPAGTFNGFRFNEPVTRRIDYIFVDNKLIVLQYAVLSDSRDCHYPSDHLPVLARMEW